MKKVRAVAINLGYGPTHTETPEPENEVAALWRCTTCQGLNLDCDNECIHCFVAAVQESAAYSTPPASRTASASASATRSASKATHQAQVTKFNAARGQHKKRQRPAAEGVTGLQTHE